MRTSILTAVSGAVAALAPDTGIAGGLNSDDPITPEAPAQPETTDPVAEKAPTEQAPTKKSSAKKSTAKKSTASLAEDEVVNALKKGFHAVVWCQPGHERFSVSSLVMVEAEDYDRLRGKGHARDADDGELAAAIKDGRTIHWY